MIDNLFCRNQARCVTKKVLNVSMLSMYAFPFLLQATHADQRLRVCRIILVNAFP